MYYPFDITPSFWDFMKQHIGSGGFILINKVTEEIAKGKDALNNWIQTQIPSPLIVDCNADPNIISHYGSIMIWGNSHAQYNTLAKTEFADYENADPFIVATALQRSGTAVSQERSEPAAKKNIKLPDVCTQFGVPHIDTFTLLRTFGFTM
jgi:hypothetical protein